MQDPYFERTVVFLCRHDSDGSMGFILNKFVDIDLEDLIENMPSIGHRIGMGGPVQNTHIYFLHNLPEYLDDSFQVGYGVYIGGDFVKLIEGIKNHEVDLSKVRFFVGYSGWDENQLDSELDAQSWYIADVDDLPIFDSHCKDLWSMTLKKMGGEYANLVNFPKDPNLN